jgi:transporter family protein
MPVPHALAIPIGVDIDGHQHADGSATQSTQKPGHRRADCREVVQQQHATALIRGHPQSSTSCTTRHCGGVDLGIRTLERLGNVSQATRCSRTPDGNLCRDQARLNLTKQCRFSASTRTVYDPVLAATQACFEVRCECFHALGRSYDTLRKRLIMKVLPSWLLFSLGSAFFAGLTAILGKLGVVGMNSNLATLIRTIVIFFVTAAIVSMRSEWIWPRDVAIKPLTFLLLSGVATGLSWLCYYRALQLAPASLVAPIDKLSVAFAIALGILVLGEPFTWRLALGGGLVVAGALVIATS